MTNVCPSCNGPQMIGHPEGVLAIAHDPVVCALRTFEDATKAADSGRYWPRFQRPATPTERVLLAAFGYTLPATLNTYVDINSITGMRIRVWDNTLQPPKGIAA